MLQQRTETQQQHHRASALSINSASNSFRSRSRSCTATEARTVPQWPKAKVDRLKPLASRVEARSRWRSRAKQFQLHGPADLIDQRSQVRTKGEWRPATGGFEYAHTKSKCPTSYRSRASVHSTFYATVATCDSRLIQSSCNCATHARAHSLPPNSAARQFTFNRQPIALNLSSDGKWICEQSDTLARSHQGLAQLHKSQQQIALLSLAASSNRTTTATK